MESDDIGRLAGMIRELEQIRGKRPHWLELDAAINALVELCRQYRKFHDHLPGNSG